MGWNEEKEINKLEETIIKMILFVGNHHDTFYHYTISETKWAEFLKENVEDCILDKIKD